MKHKAIDIEDRPVIIPKATYDLLLRQDEPIGVIALYNFYYYTAVWQKTNQPKATTEYAAKGLKIGTKRIRKYKAVLLSLGLIEDIRIRNKTNTRIEHHYIRVKYYASYPGHSLQGSKRNRVVNGQGNTYSSNRENSYSYNTVGKLFPDGEIDKDFFSIYSIKLAKLLHTKRKLNKLPDLKTWKKQLQYLHIKDGVKKKKIKSMFFWYKKHIDEKFVPDIRSTRSFRVKFDSLVAAKEREDKRVDKGEPTITYIKKKKK